MIILEIKIASGADMEYTSNICFVMLSEEIYVADACKGEIGCIHFKPYIL